MVQSVMGQTKKSTVRFFGTDLSIGVVIPIEVGRASSWSIAALAAGMEPDP
jgi:hypothetical protein